jgi:hypothetical protein
MFIVTQAGEVVNAQYIVRFYLKPERTFGAAAEDPIGVRLVLHLSTRERVIAADTLAEPAARALLREVRRAWTRGQTCLEIATCLKSIETGATPQRDREEKCL